jgi:methylthioribose-1-phosphate isomerase
MRPLEASPARDAIRILDQTLLPHEERWVEITSSEGAAEAIRAMQVRGAPLIGITAAYGMALGARRDPSEEAVRACSRMLAATRPTAVNLQRALVRVGSWISLAPPRERAAAAWAEAGRIAEEEVAHCRAIGDHGLTLLRELHSRAGGRRPVRVLTHCNAGWLATLEYGTALAPVYRAHEEGLPVAVIAGETRPRNQGWLTAWELQRAGIPVTVVADNATGLLMQRGEVDVVLVGTDRTARNGDVANKIGTWLTALAARDAGVPFHAAVPSSSIDWAARDGAAIPIEEREAGEVTHVSGTASDGRRTTVRLAPGGVAIRNPGFDVTPARLVTGLITERGNAEASEAGLLRLFPEQAR